MGGGVPCNGEQLLLAGRLTNHARSAINDFKPSEHHTDRRERVRLFPYSVSWRMPAKESNMSHRFRLYRIVLALLMLAVLLAPAVASAEADPSGGIYVCSAEIRWRALLHDTASR